jgi:hypothetical protein
MEWVKVYDKAFNLHTNPRPRILIIRQFQSRFLTFETTKIGSWDFNFVGWIIPVVNTPTGVSEGKYRRLYLGRQTHLLCKSDFIGNLEIKPRLWIPDLTVRVWELQGYADSDETILTNLDRIEQKIDDISSYGGV